MSRVAPPQLLQTLLRWLGLGLFAYMAYATLYGPYRTTIVHLAIYAAVMLVIAFLGRERNEARSLRIAQWSLDIVAAAAAAGSMLYLVVEFERLLNLWGSSYLTTLDVWVGLTMVAVAIEAARRQSTVLALLGVGGVLYMLYGNYLPGVFSHAGMEIPRFTYLVSYTTEGLFGTGLQVAAGYLFMLSLIHI